VSTSIRMLVLVPALLACAACGRKEDAPIPLATNEPIPAPGTVPGPVPSHATVPGMPPPGMPGAGMPAAGMPVAHQPARVVVPDAVKGKWKAIRLAVTDIASGKETLCTVALGSEFRIPGSGLTLQVETILPHFAMGGGVITSRSNQPENPAARIRIAEAGKDVYGGWMFTKFPEAHAFEHPKYRLRLVEILPAP
jgi:hypothetical protein